MTPIKYIGKRSIYRERTYGSGLVFGQGETVSVEDDVLARKLLRHPDVYVAGDAKEATATAAAGVAKKGDDAEDDAQITRDLIANMNKSALATYANTTFNVNLDGRKNIGELRAQVTGLFDQFGVE